ncbi:MAG: glutathione S-transferase family protein [Pseudomonadota bacterium]|nr:glutathione S-transferase family protein [Pseudomonadota bacterium]
MLTLVIGNKNLSSWSLRPWLLLRQFDVAFEERMLLLDSPGFEAQIATWSPNRRVPALHHDGLLVWDSLAICEYVNESFLAGRGWPDDAKLRALARSAVAEMHSGFAALRKQLPMNCARQPDAALWDEEASRDIARIQQLWITLKSAHDNQGGFLCGEFGIVDAMFAPVAVRFAGYGVEMDGTARAFVDAIYALPAFREWHAAGVAETLRAPPATAP